MPPLIWLIEDRADVADSLIYTLETEGFNVCWFSHSQPALDALKQQTPQLAIVHTVLPDGSGIALGRVLQTRHPALPLLFFADNSEQLTQLSSEAPPHSTAIAAPSPHAKSVLGCAPCYNTRIKRMSELPAWSATATSPLTRRVTVPIIMAMPYS